MKGVTHMENFNLETLEKGIKKRSRIRNLLIVLVILLALYTVIIAGDISSAKTKEKNRHATEMAELDTAVEELEKKTADDEAKIEKYNESISELEEQIAELKGN